MMGAGREEAHGELDVAPAVVTLVDLGVADGELGGHVVVEDDARTLVVGDLRVSAGAVEMDGEGLGGLLGEIIVVDVNGHGLRRLARREGEDAVEVLVVLRGRGRAVGGGDLHGDRLVAPREQLHREAGVVVLEHLDVVDGQPGPGIVVDDGGGSLVVAVGHGDAVTHRQPDGGRIGQAEAEPLVGLGHAVADDRHRHLDFVRPASREGDRLVHRVVVAPAGGGVVRRGVGGEGGHGDGGTQRQRRRDPDREDGVLGPGITLDHGIATAPGDLRRRGVARDTDGSRKLFNPPGTVSCRTDRGRNDSHPFVGIVPGGWSAAPPAMFIRPSGSALAAQGWPPQ